MKEEERDKELKGWEARPREAWPRRRGDSGVQHTRRRARGGSDGEVDNKEEMNYGQIFKREFFAHRFQQKNQTFKIKIKNDLMRYFN